MFYLTKFCRICIKTGDALLDLNSQDFDLVKLSEKLEFCTKMVISKEDLSTLICMSCVKKLRISYVFQTMCMKSDDILQGYLNELMNDAVDNKFINSDLRVSITPLPKIKIEKELDDLYSIINNNNTDSVIDAQMCFTEHRSSPHDNNNKLLAVNRMKRKRVSKGQRCSLLKKLLSTINSNDPSSGAPPAKPLKKCGGLKDLLGFIKHYDFGYKPSEPMQESTPLDKLETFSRTFFYTDFTDYRNTILAVIDENKTEGPIDDDEMFDPFDEEEDGRLWNDVKREIPDEIEPSLLEPEIKIKTEPEYEADYLPSEFVQACYDRPNPSKDGEYVDFESYLMRKNCYPNQFPSFGQGPSSLEMLQQLALRTKGSKTLSPNSVKCRTRGHPFINPELMEQFKSRSFKCDTCNRSFKSPGYLHSHCTKMGH